MQDCKVRFFFVIFQTDRPFRGPGMRKNTHFWRIFLQFMEDFPNFAELVPLCTHGKNAEIQKEKRYFAV